MKTKLLHDFQKFLLRFSYHSSKIFVVPRKRDWLIGVSGICGLVGELSRKFDSYSICLEEDPYFPQHNFSATISPSRLYRLKRLILGPILLGFYLNRVSGVFYVSDTAFLISSIDANEFEYSFIRSRSLNLVLWYTGSDIRSMQVTNSSRAIDDFEDFGSIIPMSNPKSITEEYERNIFNKVKVAEEFANLIFNHHLDQKTYFSKKVYDTKVIVQHDLFRPSLGKFDDLSLRPLKVLHAATNPIIKGTPLIHAAINRLRQENFCFEFIELEPGTPRESLLRELVSSHVVINQLYARIPGHFGYEAMANTCVVLQSADLPGELDKNPPWIETHSHQIYDKLKWVLENPLLLAGIARAGYEFSIQNAHPDQVQQYILEVFSTSGLKAD
jgi:hypothetical protein